MKENLQFSKVFEKSVTFMAFFDDFWLHFRYHQPLDTKCELILSKGANRCALGPCSNPNYKVGQDWHFLAIFDYFWD